MSPVEPAPDCGWALEILLEARDRLHDPDTGQRLNTHLEACADCRHVHRAERRLARVLAESPLPPAPEELLVRVKSLVQRRRFTRRLAVTGLAAALLGVAGMLLAVLR
jgi:predicted anti-sigma-YlaC factor YlaD